MKNIEVLLNQKNDYDFPDPTAYLAVKNIVNTNLRKEME